MDNEQFVRDALSGNAVEAQATFDALMRDRVSAKLDTYRAATAATLFDAEEPQEQPQEVEANGNEDSSIES
jgi:hypothetical protein